MTQCKRAMNSEAEAVEAAGGAAGEEGLDFVLIIEPSDSASSSAVNRLLSFDELAASENHSLKGRISRI